MRKPPTAGEGSRDLPRLLVEQAERPHGRTGRDVDQIWIAGAQCVDAADAAHDRHVLLTVLLPGDRLSDDARRRLEAPQDLAGLSVEGLEFAGHDAGEHE